MIMMADKKKVLNMILGPHEPDGEPMEKANALHAIAEELIEAVNNHDVKGVADALHAAFAECENYEEGEHEEVEHIEE